MVGPSPGSREDSPNRSCGRVTVAESALESPRRELAEGASEAPYESMRAGSGCLSIRKLARHHPVVGPSPGSREDSPNRSCGRVTVAESALESPRRELAEGASEAPYESMRAGSGCLSIRKLARHHPVVGPSPRPRGDRLLRYRNGNSVEWNLAPNARANRMCNGVSVTASVEVIGSWIRRLSHLRAVSCKLSDAQSPAPRPEGPVRSLGCAPSEHPKAKCQFIYDFFHSLLSKDCI